MKAVVVAVILSTTIGSASYVRAPTPAGTLTIPIPSQGTAFTSTVPGCGTVEPFVVVGIPNGTFFPGTQTFFIPPQASPTSSTFINTQLNATEVIILATLPGSCEPYLPPSTSTSGAPSSTGGPDPGICDLQGCSKIVNDVAQEIIDALNQVTVLSQQLQDAAKSIGLKRSSEIQSRALTDLLDGLRRVPLLLTSVLPVIQFASPIPEGCDSDTIVVALIDFVRVHQALLEILIGRSSLLSSGSFGFGGFNALPGQEATVPQVRAVQPGKPAVERFPNPLGIAVAAVLRSIESVVDNIAFGLIGLIPTRDACLKQQKFSIDKTLDDAIGAYSS
ncbi:hypothetical protein JX266_003347 [Neoarthrinium moseri]|nr:hypothetical protein JX266_003347 [Neoarthrinium moseri]